MVGWQGWCTGCAVACVAPCACTAEQQPLGCTAERNRAATHGTHPVTSVLSAEQVTPLQAGSHGLAVAGPQSPSTSPPLLRAVLNASSVPACSLKVGGGGGEGDGAGLGLGAGSGGGGLGEGTGTGLGTNGDGLGSAGRREPRQRVAAGLADESGQCVQQHEWLPPDWA